MSRHHRGTEGEEAGPEEEEKLPTREEIRGFMSVVFWLKKKLNVNSWLIIAAAGGGGSWSLLHAGQRGAKADEVANLLAADRKQTVLELDAHLDQKLAPIIAQMGKDEERLAAVERVSSNNSTRVGDLNQRITDAIQESGFSGSGGRARAENAKPIPAPP